MRTRRHLLTLSALTLLIACGSAGTQGTVIAGDTATINQRLDWATTMQGERISVDGYIWMTDTEDDNGEVTLSLQTAANGAGTSLLSFDIQRGDGANEILLNTEETASKSAVRREFNVDMASVRYNDNAGAPHPWSQRVRLSGTVEYVEDFQGGYSKISGPGNRDYYSWALTDVRLDTAP